MLGTIRCGRGVSGFCVVTREAFFLVLEVEVVNHFLGDTCIGTEDIFDVFVYGGKHGTLPVGQGGNLDAENVAFDVPVSAGFVTLVGMGYYLDNYCCWMFHKK